MQFIATYDRALPPAVCRKIIAATHGVGGTPGRVGVGVLPSVKRSQDYQLEDLPLDTIPEALSENLWTHLTLYTLAHPHLVTGTLTPTLPEGQPLAAATLQQAPFRTVTKICQGIFALGEFNLQHYVRERGGYPHWHSEIAPSLASTAPLHRLLFAIYYLNDVEVGGQTEFAAQAHSVRPKAGRLLLAPAGFTHTHRGQVPRSSDKWIITTWISFRLASELRHYSP